MAELNSKKSLKDLRKDYQNNGVFYSSESLALRLKSLFPNNGDDAQEIYDPTCGGGSLLAVFGDNVKKYGQELDQSQAEWCQNNLVNAEIVAGNTLSEPAFFDKKFKYIIANPPFSVKWQPMPTDPRFCTAPAVAPSSKADFAFILHCLYYLADDGVAVILGPHGPLFREGAEGKIRRWLLEKNFIEKIVVFGPDEFEDTAIATAAIVINKNKTTTDVVIEDTVLNKGRVVTFEEIEKNNFSLSSNLYIKDDEKFINVDPIEKLIQYKSNLKEMIVIALETERMLQGASPAFNVKKLKAELKEAIDSVDNFDYSGYSPEERKFLKEHDERNNTL